MHHQRSFNFLYLNKQLQVQINNQGSRTITQEALQILNRVWRHKTLSPCIKAFTWRLMRRALATGARAGTYTAKISKECATCNLFENDSAPRPRRLLVPAPALPGSAAACTTPSPATPALLCWLLRPALLLCCARSLTQLRVAMGKSPSGMATPDPSPS